MFRKCKDIHFKTTLRMQNCANDNKAQEKPFQNQETIENCSNVKRVQNKLFHKQAKLRDLLYCLENETKTTSEPN